MRSTPGSTTAVASGCLAVLLVVSPRLSMAADRFAPVEGRGLRVDGRMPFVFVAGLEGTGHHWYKALYVECGEARCAPSLVGPLAWQRAAAVFTNEMAADAPAAELAAEAAAREASGTATLYCLNSLGHKHSERVKEAIAALEKKGAPVPWNNKPPGMGSYPNTGGADKALHMPSMAFLAEALSAAGARETSQLRIVVSTRDPAAIAKSVCDNRHFAKAAGGCATEIAMLVLGAAAVAAQLDALPPPPDAVCEAFAFEDLVANDAAALAALGAFLGLDDVAALAEKIKGAKYPTKAGPRGAREKRERATLVAQLDAAQRAAVGACARQRDRQASPTAVADAPRKPKQAKRAATPDAPGNVTESRRAK